MVTRRKCTALRGGPRRSLHPPILFDDRSSRSPIQCHSVDLPTNVHVLTRRPLGGVFQARAWLVDAGIVVRTSVQWRPRARSPQCGRHLSDLVVETKPASIALST